MIQFFSFFSSRKKKKRNILKQITFSRRCVLWWTHQTPDGLSPSCTDPSWKPLWPSFQSPRSLQKSDPEEPPDLQSLFQLLPKSRSALFLFQLPPFVPLPLSSSSSSPTVTLTPLLSGCSLPGHDFAVISLLQICKRCDQRACPSAFPFFYQSPLSSALLLTWSEHQMHPSLPHHHQSSSSPL